MFRRNDYYEKEMIRHKVDYYKKIEEKIEKLMNRIVLIKVSTILIFRKRDNKIRVGFGLEMKIL